MTLAVHTQVQALIPNTLGFHSKPDQIAELESRRQVHAKVVDHNSSTLEELQTAIVKLKKRKAPGPDKLCNELFCVLDDHN